MGFGVYIRLSGVILSYRRLYRSTWLYGVTQGYVGHSPQIILT